MLGVELDQRLGVVDRRLNLCFAAHHPRVGQQPRDVRLAVSGDGDRIETRERFANSLPFGVDHAPVHPRLKHWPRQRLQVPRKICGPPSWRRRAVHLDPPAYSPGRPSNIAANGRASKITETEAILPSRTRYHSQVRELGTGAVWRS